MDGEPLPSGQSRDLFQLVVENVKDYAIFMVDLDGRIISWNPGVQRLFGYSEEEFIGNTTSLIFIPDDIQKGEDEREMEKAAVEGRSEDRRWHMRKDGTRFWANGVMMAMRDHTGELCAYAKITRDETEHKRLEDEIARANSLKDEFLTTLSHELRTPLTAILGWIRLLRSGDLDEQTIAGALETIERNAHAQTQLIEDILDISRIINGKLQINYSPVDITGVLDEVIESAKPAAETKGLHWDITCDPSAILVSGDSGRLRQIIWNLLSNAIKFTPSGGTIRVQLHRAGTYAHIIISDTGRGISREFLPFVFDRFAQEDTGNRRRHAGLGIGLSLVRHLTELHGGNVYAESEGEGQGATFTIRLPLIVLRHPAQQMLIENNTSRHRSLDPGLLLHGVRILVVDDDEDARALIATILHQQGAAVVLCGSVAEALESIAQQRPDALVSDIGMPGQNGYDLIRTVRNQPEDQLLFLPAIAVSAYAGTDTRVNALLAGFQMYMAKPVDPAELVAALVIMTGRGG